METMRELYERVRRQEQERGRSFPDWEDDGEMDCLLHPSRTKEKVSAAVDGSGRCKSSVRMRLPWQTS